MDKLRSSCIDIEAGAELIDHQIPRPCTCSKELLKSIAGCTDPAIQAVIASIKNELNEMTTDFDGVCQLVVLCCPVTKQYANKRQRTQISSTNGYYGDGQEAPRMEWIPNKKEEWYW